MLLYAGFRVLWPAVGKPAETLTALLGLVVLLFFCKKLRGTAPLWLLWAAVGVQILSWSLGYLHHPEWVASNPRLDRLAKIFIFIAVAWWLGGSTRNTLLIWSVALLAYMVASYVHGDGIQEWINGFQGQRAGFGIRNKQHGSMLYGVVFLGLAIFSSRIMAVGRFRVPRIILWILLMFVSLVSILIGQTRAVWLALVLSFFIALIMWVSYNLHKNKFSEFNVKSVLLTSVFLLVFGVIAVSVFYEPLVQRISEESEVVSLLLSGNISEIPYTSVGFRIHTWATAIEWIQERPMVGWGSEARSLVIEHTPGLPDFLIQNFGHLHNYLLEILVAYGFLGLAVIGALAFWVGRGTWLSWRAGVMPGDIALFGVSFFVYWVVVNQFESYNSFWTGVYVHNLVLGGLVTHIWRWQISSQTRLEIQE